MTDDENQERADEPTEEDSRVEKETVRLAETDAVVETDDGETVLKMESLQKGGGDAEARFELARANDDE
jgi:hypothetical protein